MTYTPPSDEQIQRAIDIIYDAPQSSFFTKERVTSFIQRIIENEDDLLFHAKRLHGIGPSEAGFLVTSFRNHNREPGQPFEAAFRSAYDVYREKHLLQLPESKPEMQRGTKAESTIRELYVAQLRESGFTVEDATAEKQAIAQWRASGKQLDSNAPWLRSINIDDLMRINGRLTLVDYKATSSEMLEKLKVDIGTPYKVQLHLYKHGLECIDVKIDDMKLVPFNYNEWKAEEIDVPISQPLLDQTLEACSFYHNLIVTGKRPPIIKPAEEIFDPERIPQSIKDLANEVGMLSALEDSAREIRQAKSAELKAHFEQFDVQGQVNAILGPVNATMKSVTTYDDDGLLAAADELGLAVAKGTKGKKLFNAVKKESDNQQRHDVNADDYIDVKFTTTIRAATGNSAGSHLRGTLKENSGELVQGIASTAAVELRDVSDLIDDEANKQEFYARRTQEMYKQLYEEYVTRNQHSDYAAAAVESIESDVNTLEREFESKPSQGLSEEQAQEFTSRGAMII